MLYSKNGDYPTILPNRIRMSNGFTRTGRDTFTEEEIKDSGYISVPDKPQAKIYQEIRWISIELKWDVIKLEKNIVAEKIRELRYKLIQDELWKIERYNSEIRLGLEPTDNIEAIDKYIQELRDITKQKKFPYEITWPTLGVVLIEEVEEEQEIVMIRVYELAKEFELNSKQIVEILSNEGEDVKSHLSSIEAKVARKIINEKL